MKTSMLQDGGPVIADAVRDASKAVGSMIQTPVQKLHVPHVSMPHVSGHVPPVHLPSKRRRRRSARSLAVISVVALVVAGVAMLRRRQDDANQLA